MPDPKPEQRVYYRHFRDGTRAYMVERDGQPSMKLDRPNADIVLPYQEAHWIPERENRPCTRAGIARACFEFDKFLCLALGMHTESKRNWLNLAEQRRIEWMSGHKTPPRELKGVRRHFYVMLMRNLEPISTE